jgi:Immunity protein 49
MDKIESLLRVVESKNNYIGSWIKYYSEGGNLYDAKGKVGLVTLWNHYQCLSLKAIFIDQDFEAARQHSFTCGKLDEFAIVKQDSSILEYGLDHISLVLLSDNKELMSTIASIQNSTFKQKVEKGFATPVYILQCLIKDDIAEAERAMLIMQEKTLKKYPTFAADLDFYRGIIQKDEALLNKALAKMLTPRNHGSRTRAHPLIHGLISIHATGYAKLAWLKGLKVEVNSVLVPAGILPLQPLAQYNREFDFFL